MGLGQSFLKRVLSSSNANINWMSLVWVSESSNLFILNGVMKSIKYSSQKNKSCRSSGSAARGLYSMSHICQMLMSLPLLRGSEMFSSEHATRFSCFNSRQTLRAIDRAQPTTRSLIYSDASQLVLPIYQEENSQVNFCILTAQQYL